MTEKQSRRSRALATAKAAAIVRGHQWRDDHVKVIRTWRGYVVHGNYGWRGGQIRVRVHRDGTTIRSYWIAPG